MPNLCVPKLQSWCQSKDNAIPNVEQKTTILCRFCLKEYNQFIKLSIFCGTQDRFLQVMKKTFFFQVYKIENKTKNRIKNDENYWLKRECVIRHSSQKLMRKNVNLTRAV